MFRLLTWSGQRVLSVPNDGRLVHAVPGHGGASDILAVFSTLIEGHCFLLDGRGEATLLRCGHPMHRAPVLPMRVHRQATSSDISLLYPVNRKYLCARPATADEQFGTVWADHDDPGPGRIFVLEAVSGIDAPVAASALAMAVEALFVVRHDADRLLQRLGELEPRAAGAALDAVLPALTTPQLDQLARLLVDGPQRITALSRLLQPDVWALHGLPQLADWLARRACLPPAEAHQPAATTLGAAYDQAALLHWRNGFVSSSHELNAALRRSVEPRRKLCVVAPARNEGVYLLEWIAYHRALGIEAFFLYTNDNQDGSDTLLDALSRAGVITWFDNQARPASSALAKCSGHALAIMPELLDFRWAVFIDLDEFVVVDPGAFASLDDYIEWQELQDVDAIALNWMFMRSSRQGALDGLLTERCQWQSPGFDNHVKSLCRPRRFVQATSHFPLCGERRSAVLRSASGRLHQAGSNSDLDPFEAPARSERPDGAMAWVNHYFFKSAEEYMWKFSRNRGGGVEDAGGDVNVGLTPHFLDAFLQQSREERVTSRTPLLSCRGPVATEMAGLLALPEVAAALGVVQERYRSRLARVKQAFRCAPVITQAGDRGEEFLALAGAA